jgi:hypothetical protein
LKDDVLNFLKTHTLIGDNIMGNLVQFVDQQVVSIGVDTIQSVGGKVGPNSITGSSDSDVTLINVYYLGTG